MLRMRLCPWCPENSDRGPPALRELPGVAAPAPRRRKPRSAWGTVMTAPPWSCCSPAAGVLTPPGQGWPRRHQGPPHAARESCSTRGSDGVPTPAPHPRPHVLPATPGAPESLLGNSHYEDTQIIPRSLLPSDPPVHPASHLPFHPSIHPPSMNPLSTVIHHSSFYLTWPETLFPHVTSCFIHVTMQASDALLMLSRLSASQHEVQLLPVWPAAGLLPFPWEHRLP